MTSVRGIAKSLLAVGDVLTDVICESHEDLQHSSDAHSTITLDSGGSAANVSAWFAHLGGEAALACCLGHDLAEFHSGQLRSYRVEPLATVVDRPSGTAVVIVHPDKDRSFLTDRGAAELFNAAMLPAPGTRGFDAVLISAYLGFGPSGQRILLEVALRARELYPNAVIALDLGSETPLRSLKHLAVLDPLNNHLAQHQSLVDIVFGTSAECQALNPSSLDSVPLVIEKRGSLGASARLARRSSPPMHIEVPATPVEPALVKDTIGAGDAFAAGFLTAHLNKQTTPECLKAGCDAAALAITRRGGKPLKA